MLFLSSEYFYTELIRASNLLQEQNKQTLRIALLCLYRVSVINKCNTLRVTQGLL